MTTCRHCGRPITYDSSEGWIDPEAPTEGDDSLWRTACDRHDTFTAEHEPGANDLRRDLGQIA